MTAAVRLKDVEGPVVIARPKGLRECEGCGIYFAPSYEGVKLCDVCRPSAYLRACEECGIEFAPRHPSAKYHSDACRQKAYWRRKNHSEEETQHAATHPSTG